MDKERESEESGASERFNSQIFLQISGTKIYLDIFLILISRKTTRFISPCRSFRLA